MRVFFGPMICSQTPWPFLCYPWRGGACLPWILLQQWLSLLSVIKNELIRRRTVRESSRSHWLDGLSPGVSCFQKSLQTHTLKAWLWPCRSAIFFLLINEFFFKAKNSMLQNKLSHFFTPVHAEKNNNSVPKQFSPQEGNQYQWEETCGLEINKASSFLKSGFADLNCVIQHYEQFCRVANSSKTNVAKVYRTYAGKRRWVFKKNPTTFNKCISKKAILFNSVWNWKMSFWESGSEQTPEWIQKQWCII